MQKPTTHTTMTLRPSQFTASERSFTLGRALRDERQKVRALAVKAIQRMAAEYEASSRKIHGDVLRAVQPYIVFAQIAPLSR